MRSVDAAPPCGSTFVSPLLKASAMSYFSLAILHRSGLGMEDQRIDPLLQFQDADRPTALRAAASKWKLGDDADGRMPSQELARR